MDKEEVKKLFIHESTYGYIEKIIESATKLYRNGLDLKSFKNLLLFPWNDWPLFQHLEKAKLLDASNKLRAVSLEKVVRYKRQFSTVVSDNNHDFRIEKLKESMLTSGYRDDGKLLVAFETEENSIFYSIDGHHRLIAYLDLIETGKLQYVPISSIFAEINSITDIVGKYNILK